jgi:hypothetical protein
MALYLEDGRTFVLSLEFNLKIHEKRLQYLIIDETLIFVYQIQQNDPQFYNRSINQQNITFHFIRSFYM